jgi:PPK2 family polyphosphate:nucleotide phosphotransferase
MNIAEIPSKGFTKLSRKELKKENKQLSKDIIELQNKLMADGSQSLLVIFQGVDASGKDGALKDVFRAINPAGCNVYSFKKPTAREMRHDFLWRVHQVCPAAGMIQIFNRSHYEDILVPSVEGFIPKEIIEKRFKIINDFEKMLEANGTKILKFYLNISKDRQEEKLSDRVNIQEKHWKHNDGDWEVRKKWDQYMEVYNEIFEKCNDIPWHIIPADDNKEKANAIAKIVIDTMEAMDLEYPDLKSEKFEAGEL